MTAFDSLTLARRFAVPSAVTLLAGLLVLTLPQAAAAAPPVLSAAALLPQQISADPYSGGGAQHATEVEPHLAAWGTDVVAAFQVGRFNAGGSATNIGWSTSHDGGASWTSGMLPGVTTAAGGPWARTVDQNVAYDTKHATWLIGTLGSGLLGGRYTEQQLLVSRSANGQNWSAPVSIVATGQPDKSWVTCDNGPASPYRGNCYALWQQTTAGNSFRLSRSTDGGLTWGASVGTPTAVAGYNVQPVVQPNGTLIVVATDYNQSALVSFRSTNGGATLTQPATFGSMQKHAVSQLRAFGKPTVAAASDGRVYAVWHDCRFRAGCTANDLVMATSMDGAAWSPVTRIGPDSATGTVDHFLPGLGVDPATSGATTRLSVLYHYYPTAACGASGQPACQLHVGIVQSADGGQTWSAPTTLTQTSQATSSLPTSYKGQMVGDYFGLAYSQGNAVTAYPVAVAPASAGAFNQAMYAVVVGPKTVAVAPTTVTQPAAGAHATATFTVQLSAPQPAGVTVQYQTADGTATAASGVYTPVAGTLTIPAGAQTAAVDVPISDDGVHTGSRTFSLQLANPVGVTLARTSAAATILDPGTPPPPPPPPAPAPATSVLPALSVTDRYATRGTAAAATAPVDFDVTLNQPSTSTVSVSYATATGTAAAGSDYTAIPQTTLTFTPGQTRQTVSVQSFGTAVPKLTSNFRLVLSSPVGATLADPTGYGYLVAAQGPPQVTVLAASASEGNAGTATMNFTIQLNAPTSTPVTASYSTANGTAIAGTDYQAAAGSVTIPAGATTAQVPVAVIGNTTAQADRTLTLNLTSATNGLRSNTAANGTILDDDGGHTPTPPAPAVYIGDTYLVRGTDPASGPTAQFQLWLTRPATVTTTVQYSTTNGSAAAGTDYTATTGTATIPAGQTQTTVSVPVRGTAGAAPTVYFKILLTAPAGAVLGDGTGIGYLAADAGPAQVSPRDTSVVEGAAGTTTTMTFPIELTAAAAKPVVISYATADGTATVAGGDYQQATGSVTIPAGSTKATVAVIVNGNATAQVNRTFSLKVNAVSGGAAIDPTATATIIDDD